MGFYADVSAAAADSCRHYWDMNEATGTVLVDSISGFDLTLSNLNYAGNILDTIVDSPFGKGRDTAFGDDVSTTNYSGYGSLFSSPDVDAIHTEGTAWLSVDYSCRFRFKLREVHATNWSMIFSSSQSVQGSNKPIAVWVEPATGRINVYCWGDSIDHYSTFTVTPNEWVDVVVTSSASGSKLYVNGSLDSSFAAASIKPYETQKWYAGGTSTNGFFLGYIDEFAIWERELSASDVSSISAVPLIGDVSAPPVIPPDALAQLKEVVTYRAILTGAGDALSDLSLQISSFNARLRSGRDSYLSLVCPHGESNIAGIEARPNGALVIQQVAGSEVTELARVNFQDLRIDKGASVGSTLTLSGYKQTTYADPASWSTENHSYYSKGGGKSRIRMQANASVRPGDSMTAEGAAFVIDTVTLIGSVNRVYMELSE